MDATVKTEIKQETSLEAFSTSSGETATDCMQPPRAAAAAVQGNVPSYTCIICEKSFNTSENLRRHHIIHSLLYMCPICNKSFLDGSKLRRHEITHTGERPYECDQCGRRLSRKEHLQRHMLVHSTNRPFKCELCNYVARRRDTVRQHIKNKHGSVHVQTALQRSERAVDLTDSAATDS